VNRSALRDVGEPLLGLAAAQWEAALGSHVVGAGPHRADGLVVRDGLGQLVFITRAPVEDDPHPYVRRICASTSSEVSLAIPHKLTSHCLSCVVKKDLPLELRRGAHSQRRIPVSSTSIPASSLVSRVAAVVRSSPVCLN
jgi:hypothetical protein